MEYHRVCEQEVTRFDEHDKGRRERERGNNNCLSCHCNYLCSSEVEETLGDTRGT